MLGALPAHGGSRNGLSRLDNAGSFENPFWLQVQNCRGGRVPASADVIYYTFGRLPHSCGSSNCQFPARKPHQIIIGATNRVGGRVDFINCALKAFRCVNFPFSRDRMETLTREKRVPPQRSQQGSTASAELLSG